ncbi:hypothetical protein E8E13_006870 [Curvularia kusanoi]|uniref:P-loop containing nucleoside triphosphate hydrolase protein n=1 Tax=Curvularia kusanoi TaxID=90978 RepID=A0A9P4TM57_CURKU|nr:hypothetical protein E8E13_006870 [Curvularia kusanoi]
MGEDVEARKLGERLLLDVQVEGLNSILSSLRALDHESTTNNNTTANTSSSIPELDTLLPLLSPTILELISPPTTHHPSGAGKTSLLYLIIAHAILPSTFASVPLNGQSSAVILLDPLQHFSARRLASVILHLVTSKLPSPIDTTTKASLLDLTSHCLDHVHIFHPSSWSSLLATLRSLPRYLFTPTAHKSSHRRIHSLILEDIDAFVWSLRDTTNRSSRANNSSPLTPVSRQLTAEIKNLTDLLSCHAILTSRSVHPTLFRPPLPTTWPAGMSVTRMGVRRVEVVKFAPGMSAEQAKAESGQRWEVVARGRFEAWRVGSAGGAGAGAGAGNGDGEGFVFRVGAKGVEIEREGGGG